MATHFDEYEKHAQSLERISETLAPKSSEYVALERAGWALAFVTMYHCDEFQKFLDDKDSGELLPEQLAYLKQLGLE